MSITIGKLEFEGPFDQAEQLRPEPGIYATFCHSGEEYDLIELGESSHLPECFTSEEHGNNLLFYAETCGGKLVVAVHYTNDLSHGERLELRIELLGELNEEPLEAAC